VSGYVFQETTHSINHSLKIENPLQRGDFLSSKPVSRVLFSQKGISIINLALLLLKGSINLPILTACRSRHGSEQLRFQNLFGFSTPEVYRDPGRPEKP
jgi:hypothetical protein